MSESNKLIARRFFEELYSTGDTDLVNELVAEDYVAHGPGSQVQVLEAAVVRAEGVDAVIHSIINKPPDIVAVVEEQIAEDDKVVSRVTISAGGKSWVAVAIQRFADNKLVETWRIANSGV